MKYKGLTVNERLYVGGLMDEYEEAEKNRNVRDLVRILMEVELEETNIKPILENLGLTMEEQ